MNFIKAKELTNEQKLDQARAEFGRLMMKAVDTGGELAGKDSDKLAQAAEVLGIAWTGQGSVAEIFERLSLRRSDIATLEKTSAEAAKLVPLMQAMDEYTAETERIERERRQELGRMTIEISRLQGVQNQAGEARVRIAEVERQLWWITGAEDPVVVERRVHLWFARRDGSEPRGAAHQVIVMQNALAAQGVQTSENVADDFRLAHREIVPLPDQTSEEIEAFKQIIDGLRRGQIWAAAWLAPDEHIECQFSNSTFQTTRKPRGPHSVMMIHSNVLGLIRTGDLDAGRVTWLRMPCVSAEQHETMLKEIADLYKHHKQKYLPRDPVTNQVIPTLADIREAHAEAARPKWVHA